MAQDTVDTIDEGTKQKLRQLAQKNAPGSNIQIGVPPPDDDSGPAPGGRVLDAPNVPSPLDPNDPRMAGKPAFAATGQSVEERQGPPSAATAIGGAASKLGDAWGSFIDHPENRAGMMQFAVNMLAGKGFAQSVGAGAEATGANVAAQEARQQAEEKEDLAERAQAVKESEAESYGIASRRRPVDPYERMFAAQQFQRDREDRAAYDAWVKDPLARAGILENVQKKYPNIKTKDDLDKLGNEAARAYAQEQLLGSRIGGGGAPRSSGFKPPPGAEQRMGQDGRVHYFDPKTKQYLGTE